MNALLQTRPSPHSHSYTHSQLEFARSNTMHVRVIECALTEEIQGKTVWIWDCADGEGLVCRYVDGL